MTLVVCKDKFSAFTLTTILSIVLATIISANFLWINIISIYIFLFWKKQKNYLLVILFPSLLFPLAHLIFSDFGFESILPILSSGLINYVFYNLSYMLYFGLILLFGFSFWLGSLTSVKVKSRKPNIRYILFCMYFLGLVSGVLVYLKVGGIPLFDIQLRWRIDAKLVLLLMSHIVILPALIAFDQSKNYNKLYLLMFLISLVLLAGLGARNTVIKLCFSTFFTIMLLSPKRAKHIFKITLAPILLLFFGIGLLSKSSIYGVDDFVFLPFLFLYLDMTGTFYNFDNIVRNSDIIIGYYSDFRMFSGTLLSLIPGVDAYYSNFYVTEIVNGSMFVTREINGEFLDFPMSLSPTLFGVGFASFGILGSILEIGCLGWVVGYIFKLSSRNPHLSYVGGVLGMIIFYGCYAGYVTPDNVFFLLLCIFLTIISRLKMSYSPKTRQVFR